ncbi:MAG: OmpA family protein [Syntrophaceae bacterium]|nr:OmpA family protein [Syntrophaceae bacterium]
MEQYRILRLLLVLSFLLALAVTALAETEEEYLKLRIQEESSTMVPKELGSKPGADIVSKDVIIEQLVKPQPPGQASSINFSSDLILFDFGSARLREACYPQLNQIALAVNDPRLAEIPVFFVDGHTCSIGSDENNCRLSWRRADSVVKFLVSAGVPPHRLISRGFGEHCPVASNDDEYGRRTNRRVVLKSGNVIVQEDQNMQCPRR